MMFKYFSPGGILIAAFAYSQSDDEIKNKACSLLHQQVNRQSLPEVAACENFYFRGSSISCQVIEISDVDIKFDFHVSSRFRHTKRVQLDKNCIAPTRSDSFVREFKGEIVCSFDASYQLNCAYSSMAQREENRDRDTPSVVVTISTQTAILSELKKYLQSIF